MILNATVTDRLFYFSTSSLIPGRRSTKQDKLSMMNDNQLAHRQSRNYRASSTEQQQRRRQ